jgi:hypothetical protein
MGTPDTFRWKKNFFTFLRRGNEETGGEEVAT